MGLPELQTRECACGCKKTWKCLPWSTSKYAMRSHNPQKYKSWVEERAKFKRQIFRWLDISCGAEKLSGLISEK